MIYLVCILLFLQLPAAAAKSTPETQNPSDSTGPDSNPSDEKDAVQSKDPFHIRTTVVVIDTRTEAELQKSPAAASVVTREELKLRNTQLVDQSLNLLIPGGGNRHGHADRPRHVADEPLTNPYSCDGFRCATY